MRSTRRITHCYKAVAENEQISLIYTPSHPIAEMLKGLNEVGGGVGCKKYEPDFVNASISGNLAWVPAWTFRSWAVYYRWLSFLIYQSLWGKVCLWSLHEVSKNDWLHNCKSKRQTFLKWVNFSYLCAVVCGVVLDVFWYVLHRSQQFDHLLMVTHFLQWYPAQTDN